MFAFVLINIIAGALGYLGALLAQRLMLRKFAII